METTSRRDVVFDLPGQRIRIGENLLSSDPVHDVHRQMPPIKVA